MPSPFPGMNPWLEDPRLWPDVHHGLISEIQATLNRSLLPRYIARIEERVYLSEEDDPGREFIIPDVKIRRAKNCPVRVPALSVTEPIVSITLIEPEIHEAYITLVDTTDRSVVTVIEILSPTNKATGARGRNEYLLKRRNLMTSETHFVEIDLLRRGERMDYGPDLPESDYVVHVSRIEERPRGRIWLWGLEQPLPIVPIPLRGKDADFPLALQPILDSAYERGGYRVVVDYRSPPDPPLSRKAAGWARRCIKESKVQ